MNRSVKVKSARISVLGVGTVNNANLSATGDIEVRLFLSELAFLAIAMAEEKSCV